MTRIEGDCCCCSTFECMTSSVLIFVIMTAQWPIISLFHECIHGDDVHKVISYIPCNLSTSCLCPVVFLLCSNRSRNRTGTCISVKCTLSCVLPSQGLKVSRNQGCSECVSIRGYGLQLRPMGYLDALPKGASHQRPRKDMAADGPVCVSSTSPRKH